MLDMIDGTSQLEALARALLKWWIPLVLTPIVLVGYDVARQRRGWWRRAYVALLLVVSGGFAGLDGYRASVNIRNPPEWDIQAFWISGRVAVEGGNFYDPADMHRIAAPLQQAATPLSARPVFTREILDTGFLYPPPTIFLVAPFGALDLQPAAAMWYLVHSVVLILCIIMLRRVFLPNGGMLELGVVATLTLMLNATYTTYVFGQTTFLVLLCLTIFWRVRDRPVSGLALAAGFIAKPIFAFYFAYPLLRRQWRALSIGVGALVAALALTLVAFGPEIFVTYLTSNPVSRAPTDLYVLNENQSLLAAMLRMSGHDVAESSPLLYRPFVVAASAIVAVTLWLMYRLPSARRELALAIAVPAALLIYPQSLEHYTMLLLVPMLYLWTGYEELGVSKAVVIGVLTVLYALIRYDHGYVAVAANALLWLVCVALGLRAAYGLSPRQGMRPALAGGGFRVSRRS
jgi:hypothetical protein